MAALEVAFFNSDFERGTFPGAFWTPAGAFFVPGGGFGLGHSRSLLKTNREPETHSSSRLLKDSQCTKNSHLSSGFGVKSSSSFIELLRVRGAVAAA
jgi:hypothetical protein